MLNAPVAAIPYPCNALNRLRLQSRAARFIRGTAVRSVTQFSSLPPLIADPPVPPASVAPLASRANVPVAGSVESVIRFPSEPISRE